MSGGFTPSLVRTGDLVTEEASILASEKNTYKRVGITIDSTALVANGDGNKVVKAGTVMGRVTATGKYVPYDSAATDGSEDARGILPESINARHGDVITGLIIQGSVLEARCVGLDDAAKAALTAITFQ